MPVMQPVANRLHHDHALDIKKENGRQICG
jgi:hypothetical protein